MINDSSKLVDGQREKEPLMYVTRKRKEKTYTLLQNSEVLQDQIALILLKFLYVIQGNLYHRRTCVKMNKP